jgi:hypothetical protein
MPTSPTPDIWRLLAELAALSKTVVPERITTLRRRWEQPPHPAIPFTLIAGSAKTLQLLLARWLGVDVARRFQEAGAGGQPLVIGPAPETVRPPLGAWPQVKMPLALPGHLLVLASAEDLPPATAEALSSLGILGQAVLVTLLSQPFSTGDRCLAASLATLSATGKALIVALPSDDLSPQETLEAAALGHRVLEHAGFDSHRFAGAKVWFTEGSATRPEALGRVEDLLAPSSQDQDHAPAVRLLRASLAKLLAEIEKAASAERPGRRLDTADLAESLDQFRKLLARLGKTLQAKAATGAYQDTAALRQAVLATIAGWSAGSGIENASLALFEAQRPGVRAGFTSMMQNLVGSLTLEVPAPPTAAPPQTLSSFSLTRLLLPWGVALGCGAIGYTAASLLATTLQQPWLQGLISNVAGGLCLLIGWVVARFFTRRPLPLPPAEAGKGGAATAPPAWARPGASSATGRAPHVAGWAAVEEPLITWFTTLFTSPPATIAEQISALRSQLSLPAPLVSHE